MNYIKTIWQWAEPGYRWTLETVGELVILAGRGCRWLGGLLFALPPFLPLLAGGGVGWAPAPPPALPNPTSKTAPPPPAKKG